MTTLTTKHHHLDALRPLSPELVANLAAAWDVRMAEIIRTSTQIYE